MSDALWWFGIIHAVAYAIAGLTFVLTLLIVKAHQWAKMMGLIIAWHVAKARWSRRHEDGLTDAEWKRGEPTP